MGTEFIPTMSESGGFVYVTEHDVVRTMAGESDAVRAQLAEALEQAGFRILNEAPLQARRLGTESAAAGCSNDILEYPATLDIGVKAAGPGATRVTFSYAVRNPIGYLTKGDRNTLTREAEAMIALVNVRRTMYRCLSCGAEVGGGRFCRQCGAPAAVSTPAELELLDLTVKTNVAYKWNTWGTAFMAIALVLPTILFALDQDAPKYAKRVRVLLFLTGVFGVSGLLMLLRGLWWMARGINDPIAREGQAAPIRRGLQVPDTASLPPARETPAAVSSVTEATTDLLRSRGDRS